MAHKTQKDCDVMWCTTCGAYGASAPRLLTTTCRGNPKGVARRRGMELRLRRLEQGLHLKTGEALEQRTEAADEPEVGLTSCSNNSSNTVLRSVSKDG